MSGDDKRAKLKYLQDIFRGQVEPDVVDLVLVECQYNEDRALEQLLSLTGDSSKVNSGLPSSGSKLDDLDPIDESFVIANIQQLPGQVQVNRKKHRKNDNGTCLVPNLTNSLTETLNFKTLHSKPLAPSDSLPFGSTELQYTNKLSSQENSSISKPVGIEDAEPSKPKTDVESDLVGNADADKNSNAFNNTFNSWARLQANGFSTNYGQSKHLGIKQNQSNNFNSHKKLLHQDLEGLNRVPKSARGYSVLNPALPGGYPYMFPQTTQPQAYYGGQHQYFPISSNPYSPPAFMRPEGRSLVTGRRGPETTPQFTKPSHKQHPSFKKQPDIDKKPSYLSQTNAYPKPMKTENLSLHSEKLLIILRGLPGSGKTTLARALKTKNGLILSTDDYFMKGGSRYTFNPYELSAAHEWNQNRAKRLIEGGLSPVIIDNTNTEAWEMKPYVLIGLRCGYRVDIKEPETRWKWDIKELEKRNSHGVTAKSLEKMLERYEKNITVETIKKSFRPAKLNDSEIGTKEHVSKSKINDKDQNTSTGSNSENLVHFVSNVGNELRKPLAMKKAFLSPEPPKTSVGSSDPTKCCVNGGDTPETVNHKSAQLITSTTMAEKEEPSCDEEHGEKKMDNSEVKGADIEHSSSTPNSSMVNKDELLRVENTDEEVEGSCSSNTKDGLENKAKERGDFKSQNTASFSSEKSSQDQVHACTPQAAVKSDAKNELPTLNIPSTVSQAHFPPEVKAKNIERVKVKHNTEVQNDKISPDRAKQMVVSESSIPSKTRKGKSPKVTKGVGNDLVNENTSMITAISPSKGSKDVTNTDMASSLSTTSVENTKLEMSNKNGDSPDPMKFLGACFPHFDNGVLRSSLKHYDGDFMKTVDYLLQYNENGNVGDFHSVPTTDVSTSELNSSSTSATSSSHHGLNHTAESYNEDVEGAELVTSKKTEGNSPRKSTVTPAPSTPNFKNDTLCSSLHFILETPLALQLLEMFGAFSGLSAKDALSENDRSIKIDEEFAKLLYNKWRKTVQKKMKSKASEEAKLKKNKGSSSPRVLPGSNSKQRFKPPPPEFYLPKEVPSKPRGITHVTLQEPVSLKEIMNEQLAVHVSQSAEDVDKRSKEENLDLSTKLKRSRLHGMFPGVNALSLNELFEANDYNFDNTVQQVQSSCGLPIYGNSPILPERKPADVQPINKPEDEATEYQSFDDPTYKDFRAEATTHFKLRAECIKKAALAYSKKQGELSVIYAQQARVHSTKIKEANQRAVEKILEIRANDLQNTNTLDLHDLHVNEAIEVLKSVLDERNEELFASKKRSPSYLQVITGRGSHSRDGKARIKPAVVEYLKRNEYRFEELNMGLYRVFFN